MSLIDSFNGIKIYVYYGDHMPPHIHVFYNEYHSVFAIESGMSLGGSIPGRQKKAIRIWLNQYGKQILEIFYRLNPEQHEKKNPNSKNTKDQLD